MAKGSVLEYACQRQYDPNPSVWNRLVRDRFSSATDLYRKDLFAHYGCVNAIEFSLDGDWLVSGGDDKRVLLWNVQEALSGISRPRAMKGKHNSNIFCLSFDSRHQTLFSAGNDEQVIVHDVETGRTLDVFLHQEAVYGLSVEPSNDNVFASACDDGCILIYDIREPSSTDPLLLVSSPSAFHSVAYNPTEPRLVATANSKEGVGLWDVRMPRCCLLRYEGRLTPQSAMSVRFNMDGTLLLALRRRQPPALYCLDSPRPVAQFDHKGYYNSCTMKSCCFAGRQDEFVLSGSDDFKLYAWKLPDHLTTRKRSTGRGRTNCTWVRHAHMVLKDHRSIVNQVRFNSSTMVLASSGVEKIIKLWSSFPIPTGSGGLQEVPEDQLDRRRRRYTYDEYIDLVMESGQFMSHDYSHQSVKEDPRMMAFFDSLVQRDVEGWSSDSSHSSAQSTSARADDASSSSDTEEQTTRGSRSRRQSRTPIDSSDSDQDWAPSPAAVESDSQEDQPAARTPIKRYNNDHDKAWHVAQREPPREEAKPRDESTSESQPSTSRFKRPQFRSQRSYRRHNGSADT